MHAPVTGALNITGLLHANIFVMVPPTFYRLQKEIGLVEEYFEI